MSRVWRRYALAHAHATIGSLSPRQFPRRYCYCSLQSHLMSPQTARKQATKAAASASFSASAKYNGKSLCRCRHRPSLATAESVGEQVQKEFETYHSVTICRYCSWLHLNWFFSAQTHWVLAFSQSRLSEIWKSALQLSTSHGAAVLRF